MRQKRLRIAKSREHRYGRAKYSRIASCFDYSEFGQAAVALRRGNSPERIAQSPSTDMLYECAKSIAIPTTTGTAERGRPQNGTYARAICSLLLVARLK